jgi:NDP-sugar pyrophosphorylase family protein
MHSPLPAMALLAGGLATRMYPLTESVPKSLLRVDGEPFLAHQLRLLVERGIAEIVICCGHLGERIEAYAGDGSRFGCRLRYSYDGDTLLGTGGALRRALPLLGESFLVMYGDSYLLADPARVWKTFLAAGKPALMTVFRNDGKWDTSNIEMCNGQIVCYDKRVSRPDMRYIDYGLNILHRSVLKAWPENAPFDLATVMGGLASEGELAAHEVHGRFYEIGSPDGLSMTEQMLASLRKSRESELLSPMGCAP